MKHTTLTVGICTALHFLVDALCLCCLYLVADKVSAVSLTGAFVTYNVVAFLSQPLTGIIADRLAGTRSREQGLRAQLLLSVILLILAVAAAYVVASIYPDNTPIGCLFMVAVLSGAGNSLFHTWGGKLIATTTHNDIRALGVFVSTGAVGLAVGMVWFSWALLIVLTVAICLFALVAMCCVSAPAENVHPEPDERCIPMGTVFVCVCMLALMLAVMLRSFTGEILSAGISKDSDAIILLLAVITMLGKMAGGWIARSIGIWTALALAVATTVVCLLTKQSGTGVMMAGLFAVNCTMPVTLYLANAILPRREGLAFGLLAAALMPGYLLAVL